MGPLKSLLLRRVGRREEASWIGESEPWVLAYGRDPRCPKQCLHEKHTALLRRDLTILIVPRIRMKPHVQTRRPASRCLVPISEGPSVRRGNNPILEPPMRLGQGDVTCEVKG